MANTIKLRAATLLLCLVLAIAALAPTIARDSLPEWWRGMFDPIHLGLDLQGGMHLVLGVEAEKAVETRLDMIADQVETLLREKDVVYKRVSRQGDLVAVTLYDEAAAKQVDDLLAEQFRGLEGSSLGADSGFVAKGYRLSAAEADNVREYAVRQALETMRNRVDQFGVSEPILQRQADNRILIQLPGVKDPQRALDLLGKTARLEFKMVVDNANPQDAVKGILPPGTQLLYEKRVDKQTGTVTETPMVVESKTSLTGDLLADAQVRIDNRFNEPYVAIEFNPVGAKRFDQITAAGVGRRMAIVLDDTIYSAPVIRERISGGSAQISGSFTEQAATDLAIVLRAGSLPAPVKILENRTVGPSLGRDSINQGMLSVALAVVLVVVAMIIYYRLAGVVATVALGLNLLFMLGCLSLFKATLTLPGIAGIALTLGMAIDANVLINERIREELRIGKSARAALDAGYEKAFWSIMDANLTTLMAGLILFQFGTGPIKGFAVTLSVGIATTLFTALFVTRLIYDFFMQRRHVERLSV
ncbi:MAG: protein translocase subunit SecD [Deltaproteobacteria bacterium]|nr:MAG: protein translocase subunit SecD [Deltaproteobacteria bacterium]